MSGDEVASALHWSASKISRIETNRIGIKRADLTQLLDLYNRKAERVIVDDRRRSQLMALSGEPELRGWWNGYADSIPADYAVFISLEASAVDIRCWSPELIHGLLQTENYANAIMSHTPPSSPLAPGIKQRRVEVRMRRQEILTSADQKQFTFILDEAALLHRYGDGEVMRRQLLHINEVSELPNVTIRVLAFGGPHPVVSPGPFALLKFGQVHGISISDIAYIEQLTRNDFIEDEEAAHEYLLAFDQIAAAALDEESSRQLIVQTAAERWA
jgi:hypothetical protein